MNPWTSDLTDSGYLLDTNIVSDLVRHPQGLVARRIAGIGETLVCTSIIVACELRYGAAKKGSPRLSWQLEQVLTPLKIMPFESGADHHYAAIRALLERNGQIIGPHDLFIAAHTLSLNLTLVTANIGEFSRIPELKVENWLEP